MNAPMSWEAAVAQLTAASQLFEIEERDVLGVRLRTWKAAPPTLRSVLDLSLHHGVADFVVYEDERITFEHHYRMAATLAHRLQDLGVSRGDRVAIAMRNRPEWIVTFWASVAAGAIVVPLNAWWTGDELAFALEDSGTAVVFADSERERSIRRQRAALRGLRRVVVDDEQNRGDNEPGGTGAGDAVAFEQLLGAVAPGTTPPDIRIDPDDDATIFYTSGTTGRPKGAVGTHRNACTNLMNLFFFQKMSHLRSGADPDEPGRAPARCHLLNVPLFHATGCLAALVTSTAAGSKLVLMHHFDPERSLELVERERVTVFVGVPANVMSVLDSPDLARRDVSSVRSISYGGAPAPAELVRRIRETFETAQASNGYGLTESSAATALNVGEDYVRNPDSVGRAAPVVDVAVVPEGFAGHRPPSLPAGSVGELWVRGPNVVRGYWNRPEETARSITDGWLHTGDVARIDDDGFIHIVDRIKDVVIRGGENVYSVEVEEVLFSHPAVADCAVIGVPHPRLGEEVGSVVVLRPGHKVTADELAVHVRDRVPAFAVPTRFWFRSRPLPRNPAGKVLKRTLREQVLEHHGPRGAERPARGAPWGGDASAWGS